MRRLSVLLILLALIWTATLAAVAQDHTSPPITADNADQVQLQGILGRGWFNNAVAWSPDGQFLAVGTSAGVWFHDANDLQAEPFLLETQIDTWSVAFSPDGTLLATGGQDNSLKVWPVDSIMASKGASADPLLDVFCRMGQVWWAVDPVVFSPDGQTVACVVDGVMLWDIATGENLATFSSDEGYHGDRAVAFSPDGSRIFTGGSYRGSDNDRYLRVWDGTTFELIESWRMPRDVSHLSALAVSPDGKLLAIGTNSGTLLLWDSSTGEQLQRLSQSGSAISKVAFRPDGATVIAAQWVGGVSRWDLSTGEPLSPLYHLNRDDFLHCRAESIDAWRPCPINLEILSADIHPNGTRLATVDSAGQIAIWDTGTDKILAIVTGYNLGGKDRGGASSDTISVTAIDFSADGSTLAAGTGGYVTSGGWIELWDLETQTLAGYIPGGGGTMEGMEYSPDGGQLVRLNAYDGLVLLDLATGDTIFPQGDDGTTFSVAALHPEGTLLAAVRWNGTVHLIDTSSGDTLAEWESETGHGNGAVFSPEGNILITGGEDGSVRLSDVVTGETVATLLEGSDGYVTGLAVGPASDQDGWLLAVSGYYDDAPVHLWQVTGSGDQIELTELTTLGDPEDVVRPLAFSPDGTLLASGHEHNTVRLWNPVTGDLLTDLHGHGQMITDLGFNREGTLLASSSWDGTIRLWAVSED